MFWDKISGGPIPSHCNKNPFYTIRKKIKMQKIVSCPKKFSIPKVKKTESERENNREIIKERNREKYTKNRENLRKRRGRKRK